MALSGTLVHFPQVFSGGYANLWDCQRGQNDPAFAYIANPQQTDQLQVLVGKSNAATCAWYVLDAGFNTGDANRIPSGSIITDVRVEVQKGIPVGFESGDVLADAFLAIRDGKWDVDDNANGFQAVSAASIGPEAFEGWRGLILARRPDNSNILRSIYNNTIEGPWQWANIRRAPVAGGHIESWMDTCKNTLASGVTDTCSKLVMRWRRFGSILDGYSWMEIWRAAADDGSDDTPATLLGTTIGAKRENSSISTATNGVTYVQDLDSSFIMSGQVRYVIKHRSSQRVELQNRAISMGMKNIPTNTQERPGSTRCEGLHRWLTQANYGLRTYLPTLHQYFNNTLLNSSHVGGFIASGVTGPSYSAGILDWITLSGANSHYMVSAMQSWIDDPEYTTSGAGAILCFGLAGQYDYTPYTMVRTLGGRLLVSWIAPNTAPTAVAAVTLTSGGREPLTAGFDGLGSTDPEDDTLSYVWDFGDGSPIVSGATPTHVYTAQGVYTAQLTVEDPGGLSDTDALVITVLPDRSWFVTRPAQDWHARRGVQDWAEARNAQDWLVRRIAQDWKGNHGDRDWFVAEEE